MVKKYPIDNDIAYYENTLGVKPFIFPLSGIMLYLRFPMTQSMAVAQKGVVPYVRAWPGLGLSYRLPITPILGLNEIVQGQHDGYIKKFAQGAAEFGKEYGGFFFTTMIEANADWWHWKQSPNFIPAWRHIWQIFEDQGANQYATWVLEAYSSGGLQHKVQDPELYYPGDKYVDWIGLNAYSDIDASYLNVMLDYLMHDTYKRMFKNHPQKPMMLSQLGGSIGYNQPRWLVNAYRSIKKDFPAIKAAIYHDFTQKNFDPKWPDSTLDLKGLQTLKEIFRDPYWIMAK